jgi:hypothetical protein
MRRRSQHEIRCAGAQRRGHGDTQPFDQQEQRNRARQQADSEHRATDQFECADDGGWKVRQRPKLRSRSAVEQTIGSMGHHECAGTEPDKGIGERLERPIPGKARNDFW